MQDLLVGSSAALSKRIYCRWKYSEEIRFGKLRNSRNLQENRAEVVQVWRLITKLGGVIAERRHYWREFWSINDFILRNWGACVDTIFGHVSLDAHLEVMGCRLAGGEIMTGLQENCWWGLMPIGKQPNMTKSRSGDAFMPMTSTDGCRWLRNAVCRWFWGKAQELPINSGWYAGRSWRVV